MDTLTATTTAELSGEVWDIEIDFTHVPGSPATEVSTSVPSMIQIHGVYLVLDGERAMTPDSEWMHEHAEELKRACDDRVLELSQASQ